MAAHDSSTQHNDPNIKHYQSTFPMENFSSVDKLTGSQNTIDSKMESYDPYKERVVEHPNSDVGALVHLLKSSLGSGVLAMPNAFRNSGLAFGLVATFIVGYICTHTVGLLVKCSTILCKRLQKPVLDFAETAEAAFQTGPPSCRPYARAAKLFVNTALFCTYYGATIVYIVFIAESIEQVVSIFDASFQLDKRAYMAMLFIPLTLLSLINNLKYLVPFSAAANVCLVVSFGITLFYIFSNIPPLSERDLIADWKDMPIFFSTAIFAMEGIGLVLPLENSMKKPQHFLGCPGVLNVAMSVVVGLYALLGFFGYATYGDLTKPIVTLNIPNGEIPSQIAKIAITIAMIFTYGLQIYVPNHIVTELWRNRFSPRGFTFFNIGVRIGTVVMTVVIAIAIPQLGPVISLVGAVFVSTLGLFCPAVIETVVFWNVDNGLGKYNWKLYKNTFIALFSIFALVTGAYTSILDIIHSYF